MILPLQTPIHSPNKLRDNLIMKDILDCYTQPLLLGKFRIQPLQDHNIIHVILILPHIKSLPLLQIKYPQKFPSETIKVHSHVFNSQNGVESNIYTPNQQKNKLKDIIHQIYQQFQQNSHQNHQLNHNYLINSKDFLTKSKKSTQTFQVENDQISQCCYSSLKQNQENQKISEKNQSKKFVSKKSSTDKQLTQTKNLNRHFRSKLRQVYKDLMINQKVSQDSLYIQQVFAPNRVGFQDIRKALKNQWFNKAVKKQMKTGRFLHKILRGMMGVKSKKLMIKYYHVMASAVWEPQSFIRWKYQ